MADPEDAGGKISTTDGQALFRVTHAERSMRVYSVTENELRTLTIINLAVAVLFSSGTGFIAFGIDLHKDILLTDDLPQKAMILDDVVKPIVLGIGIVLYIAGVAMWRHRHSFIDTIKRESKS